MKKEMINTPNVGEILKEEFLDPLNITAYRLSKDINVSTSTILDIVHNKRKISAEMALRLSRYFGNSYKFWLNLQNEIEIREIKNKKESELSKIKELEHIA
jgi:addiction module HigA family antidote